MPAIGSEKDVYIKELDGNYELYIYRQDIGFVKVGDSAVDLSNYYTKAEIDSKLELKADKSEIPDVSSFITKDVDNLTNYTTTSELNTLLSEKANNSDIPENLSQLSNDTGFITKDVSDLTNYTTSTQLSAELSNKQDTLESGVNIKTINGVSILGSGNIEVQGGSGSGSVVQVSTFSNLPATGSINTVYIVLDEDSLYRWDIDRSKYVCVGNDFTTITVLYGGDSSLF